MRPTAVSRSRAGLAGLLVLSLALAGCGQEGSSGSGESAAPAGAEGTVARELVLGAGADCPNRPYCLPGLTSTYGLSFKEFRPFDEPGGSQSKAALANGDIGVALVFTSDGEIAVNDWVLLEDDKKLQPSDNVTPVVNDSVKQAYGDELAKVINDLSAKLDTDDLVAMNKAVSADKQDPNSVAEAFINDRDLAPRTQAPTRSGPTIIVGSASFSESEILANLYLEVLRANGYPVEAKLKIGSREIYFPALKRGEVSFIPEYAGTLVRYIDPNQAPTTDPAKTAEALKTVLTGQGVTAYDYAPAQDQNGFAVTRATADKYQLAKLSDLAKPTP